MGKLQISIKLDLHSKLWIKSLNRILLVWDYLNRRLTRFFWNLQKIQKIRPKVSQLDLVGVLVRPLSQKLSQSLTLANSVAFLKRIAHSHYSHCNAPPLKFNPSRFQNISKHRDLQVLSQTISDHKGGCRNSDDSLRSLLGIHQNLTMATNLYNKRTPLTMHYKLTHCVLLQALQCKAIAQLREISRDLSKKGFEFFRENSTPEFIPWNSLPSMGLQREVLSELDLRNSRSS